MLWQSLIKSVKRKDKEEEDEVDHVADDKTGKRSRESDGQTDEEGQTNKEDEEGQKDEDKEYVPPTSSPKVKKICASTGQPTLQMFPRRGRPPSKKQCTALKPVVSVEEKTFETMAIQTLVDLLKKQPIQTTSSTPQVNITFFAQSNVTVDHVTFCHSMITCLELSVVCLRV